MSLSSLARSKLQSAVGSGARDNCSLHRWVLLKNSITHTRPPSTATTSATVNAIITPASTQPPVYRFDDDDDDDDDVYTDDQDSFMFPDGDALLDHDQQESVSEAQWLDSLLETLAGDKDDAEDDVRVSLLPVDDDDDGLPLSPLPSPSSSSDDLVSSRTEYISTAIAVPYPIPYPPYHPPLIRTFDLDLDRRNSLSPPPFDALPYFEDDDDDALSFMPMPEAIEDTSDDESDAPSTPFVETPSDSLIDPASVPLPHERPRPRPHVYIDAADSYFYPFELDPLPNPQTDVPSPVYNPYHQEC